MTEQFIPKITFSVVSPTSVSIIRDGKTIGHVWAADEKESPYPHDRTPHCLNSIQICGFDAMSEVWACGIFLSKKDCVVSFIPIDDIWYQGKAVKYSEYVKKFFETKEHELKTGVETMKIVEITKKDSLDITKLLSFKDWVATEGFAK